MFFTRNESGTYIPLVVNKTSVDIGRDLTIGGELLLYDTISLTETTIIGLLRNDVTLNDSGGTPSTSLTILTASNTIDNNLISNSQATFNTLCPISTVNASSVNHLVRNDYTD